MKKGFAALAAVLAFAGCAEIQRISDKVQAEQDAPRRALEKADADKREADERLRAFRERDEAKRVAQQEQFLASEQARQAAEAAERKRYLESPAYVQEQRDCITFWQRQIDNQKEIAKVSGVYDKSIMYQAGMMVVGCKRKLEAALQQCKKC